MNLQYLSTIAVFYLEIPTALSWQFRVDHSRGEPIPVYNQTSYQNAVYLSISNLQDSYELHLQNK